MPVIARRVKCVRKTAVVLAVTVIAALLTDIYNPLIFNKLLLSINGYRAGSSGKSVSTIQQSLKYLGYYKGDISGVFDSQTALAVKGFQTAKGIKADGVVRTDTLETVYEVVMAAAQKNASKGQSGGNDVNLVARAINGEARGEPYIGAVAVGAVIMNRTKDPKFPNTVAGVVYQPGAFTAITDGQINANMEERSLKAARDALNGWDPSGGAIYYYNPAKTTNKWIWSRPLIKVIGKHRFCK